MVSLILPKHDGNYYPEYLTKMLKIVSFIRFLEEIYLPLGLDSSMTLCFYVLTYFYRDRMVFFFTKIILWEKMVLVMEKNFWNSRLKAEAENLQNFWEH